MKELNSQSFPFYLQSAQWDCGPTCLKMIAAYYGKEFSLYQMENWIRIMRKGSSMIDLVDTAKKLGIHSTGLQIDITKLGFINLPVILHWDKHHFVVLFNIQDNSYFVADPAVGILHLNESDFLSHWQNHESGYQYTGILLTFSAFQ